MSESHFKIRQRGEFDRSFASVESLQSKLTRAFLVADALEAYFVDCDMTVYGKLVDDQTRCVHYHTSVDIVAIKFKCCGKFYPCYQCHDECESHPIVRWEERAFDQHAILCGVCKKTLPIRDYMGAEKCPHCNSPFNARCKNHYGIYFAVDEAKQNAYCLWSEG